MGLFKKIKFYIFRERNGYPSREEISLLTKKIKTSNVRVWSIIVSYLKGASIEEKAEAQKSTRERIKQILNRVLKESKK